MYGILAILVIVLLWNCRDQIPERVKVWFMNSKLRKWSYPLLVIAVTVGTALGIEYGVLIWPALILPLLFGLPYLWGMIQGVWCGMKKGGRALTSKEGEDAQGIAYNCLQKLGCQPEYNSDGSIRVSYQGETFHLDFSERYARFWDPLWASVKADDPDMPKIREAVNAANYYFGPYVLLTLPDENGIIRLNCCRDIMLHPACPDNVEYVRAVLDSFFEKKSIVTDCYKEINIKQEELQKTRRPVGFATD